MPHIFGTIPNSFGTMQHIFVHGNFDQNFDGNFDGNFYGNFYRNFDWNVDGNFIGILWEFYGNLD